MGTYTVDKQAVGAGRLCRSPSDPCCWVGDEGVKGKRGLEATALGKQKAKRSVKTSEGQCQDPRLQAQWRGPR